MAIRIQNNLSWLPDGLKGSEEELRVRFRFSAAERRVFQKRRPIPVSQWCERHRVVTMGSLKGRWRNQVTPYMAGIMDASFFSSVQTIIICKAPQVGGSEAVNNCIGYTIDRDPGPVLYVYPDEMTAKENSRDRIHSMIESSRRLRSFLTGIQDDAAAMRINLQHMPIYMAWARSAARLANKSIKYLVFDETDKYPITAGKRETDPISLGEKRAITYRWGRKTWKLSTPTVEAGPIWQALTTEAQVIFDYCACCPDCGEMQIMEFVQIKWPEGERDPEKMETEGLARYECRACKALWNDHKRDVAVRWGEWRARSQRSEVRGQRSEVGGQKSEVGDQKSEIRSRNEKEEIMKEEGIELFKYLKRYKPAKIGFHIPSWLSHFVGLSEVASAFLRGLVDKTKLKDFKNNHEAVPWLDYTQERKEEKILALRDDRPAGIVPGGGIVAALTAGVDTQKYGFWYEVRAWGWGLTEESWQVRAGFVDSFDAIEEILLAEHYEDVDGQEYLVSLAVHDAMGAGRTSEVYDFARMHRGQIFAFKGEGRMRQPFAFSNIDFYPGGRKAIPGGLKLLRADVNFYKNKLASKLEISPADPGAWHMNAEATEEWALHMCAEYIDDNGVWQCPESKANHGWDCSVYNLVAADLLRVRFWKRGPEDGRQKAEDRREPKKKGEWIFQRQGDWLKRRQD